MEKAITASAISRKRCDLWEIFIIIIIAFYIYIMGIPGRVVFCSIFILSILLLVKNGFAAFSCEINSACTNEGDVTVFKISSQFSNAHAQLPDQSGYQYEICCSGVDTLSNSCNGNSVTTLRLSAQTNAHVQKSTFTKYPYQACLSASDKYAVICDYSTGCSKLGKGYTCLASISSITNAHVGNCNQYPTKVCCTVGLRYDFDIRSVERITGVVGKEIELRVEINNIGVYSDSYTVSFGADLPNIIDISNPTVATGEVQSDELIFISTLIRPLVAVDNVITITVQSNNDPDLFKEIKIPLSSYLFTLPEFGLLGFIQIIAIAGVMYFLVGNKRNSKS